MTSAAKHTSCPRDYEIMMAEARAVFGDMDVAHVFAEHIAMNPGARIDWELFLELYRNRRK